MKTGQTFALFAALCFTACSGGGTDPQLTQSDLVSECGGFEQNGSPLFADPLPYCEAEQLHWQYDAASLTLQLADARVILNCCGEHSMKAAWDEEVLVVTERDAPEFADARCGCMCVFDFTMTAEGVANGILPLRLMRFVTDQDAAPVEIWSGQLDLTLVAGVLTVSDEDAGPWCEAITD